MPRVPKAARAFQKARYHKKIAKKIRQNARELEKSKREKHESNNKRSGLMSNI